MGYFRGLYSFFGTLGVGVYTTLVDPAPVCEPYWYGWENGYRSPRSACVAALEVKGMLTSETEASKASDRL